MKKDFDIIQDIILKTVDKKEIKWKRESSDQGTFFYGKYNIEGGKELNIRALLHNDMYKSYIEITMNNLYKNKIMARDIKSIYTLLAILNYDTY
jgi:hypothetical protein